MRRLEIELILFFSFFTIVLLSCTNTISATIEKGEIVVADKEALYVVDIKSDDKKILYSADKSKYVASPSYCHKTNLVVAEECGFLEKDCKIFVFNISTGDFRFIADNKQPYSMPSFSNNCDLIAFQNKTNDDTYSVNIITLDGSDFYKSNVKSKGGKINWSSNNKDIAYVNIEDEVIIENIRSGNVRTVTKGKAPFFSKGGDKLAYIANNTINILDLNNNAVTVYDSPGFMTTLEQINDWGFNDNNTSLLIGLTRMSFFAEKHYLALYEFGSDKFHILYQVPTLVGYDWLSQ